MVDTFHNMPTSVWLVYIPTYTYIYLYAYIFKYYTYMKIKDIVCKTFFWILEKLDIIGLLDLYKLLCYCRAEGWNDEKYRNNLHIINNIIYY